GLGIAILNHGEVVYQRAFGFRDVEQRLPLTDTTAMYAGSFTKSMFATMVMQLVAEGRLDLDRPIDRYLPKPLPDYEKYAELAGDERWRRITPRMLLSHTAGFPNWRFLSPDEKLHIVFEPGTRYAYSGEGINLLQFVMEAGMGMSVDSLMRERVFDRFGMRRTSMTWRGDFEGEFAIGYDEAGKPLGHRRRTGVRAAGSADSDLAGMARFLRGVLRGDGLPTAAREEMLRPQVRIRSAHQFPTLDTATTARDERVGLSYGLGWGLLHTPYGRAFFKEGHDDGWENYMIAFDGPKTGIVIMTNSSNGESIFRELLATLVGDTFTPWEWEGYTPYDAEPAGAAR
ncbi:MAG: beta-lactamase family protein, partial [Gemmatimonadetes bacterium]|nr:beta-lactamase family protein [Gemmatimonadota bacterium]